MAGTEELTVLKVPAKLKGAEAQGLKAMLAERRGRPVALDFGQVTQVGAQCLQVLLAANRVWQAEGTAFEIKNMSAEVRDGLLLCGLPPSQLGAKEAQE
ncbi:STAS domain-containing protein [Psychromarinibacter halotolerans]|uniref:STAS domain-containing protein n=1 Tax=Psychromarinibacter halotolerans TaxID=1775175 RepID=A0ABV7GS18_9RHOB|nr:STAS domain-containing protein [Psychromarinibacter halotolerans]MAQ85588.1 chemotaxis protein CheX [Maritimibacter sp.]MDF0594541.1 STAS domain-containing protein [Psychromarinibacter halotolerans]